jgi:hypothetical protein
VILHGVAELVDPQREESCRNAQKLRSSEANNNNDYSAAGNYIVVPSNNDDDDSDSDNDSDAEETPRSRIHSFAALTRRTDHCR